LAWRELSLSLQKPGTINVVATVLLMGNRVLLAGAGAKENLTKLASSQDEAKTPDNALLRHAAGTTHKHHRSNLRILASSSSPVITEANS